MAFSQDVKLPNEAFEGWNRLASAADNVEGAFEIARSSIVDSKKQTVPKRSFGFGVWDVGQTLTEEENGKLETLVANAEYSFEVESPISENIYELRQYRPGEQAVRVREGMKDATEPLLRAGFTVANKTMPDLVRNNRTTTLQSLDISPERGIATLTFSYQSTSNPPDTAITGGQIHFLTTKNWAIDSYECTTTWGRVEGKIAYQPFESSWVPSTFTQRLIGTQNNSVSEYNYKLTKIEKVPADKAKLKLEDYGVKKPEMIVEEFDSSFGFRAWLITANALVLVAIAVIYFMIRTQGRSKGT